MDWNWNCQMMTILDLRGGNEIDVLFQKSVPWVVVICIEGRLSKE